MLFPRFTHRKLFAKLFGKSMLFNWSSSPFHCCSFCVEIIARIISVWIAWTRSCFMSRRYPRR